MPTCDRCGAPCEQDDRYCAQCGLRILPFTGSGAMNTQKSLQISDVQFKLGMVYYKKGDYLHAIEMWEKVLRERPEDRKVKGLILDAKSQQEDPGGPS